MVAHHAIALCRPPAHHAGRMRRCIGSPSAIRFILDGEGTYTSRRREDIMSPGDFVQRRTGRHTIGNTSKQPMIWLDIARRTDNQFLRDLFLSAFRQKAEHAPRSQRCGALRFRRSARHRTTTAVRSSTILTRACMIYRATSTKPGCASCEPRPAAGVMPTMGASFVAAEEFQRQAIPRDRQRNFRLYQGVGCEKSAARHWNGYM